MCVIPGPIVCASETNNLNTPALVPLVADLDKTE